MPPKEAASAPARGASASRVAGTNDPANPSTPAKEPSLPPNSPALSTRGMVDWPSAARPQDLDLGTELTHAKLDAMHAHNNDRFNRLERLFMSQTTTSKRTGTPASKDLRRTSLSVHETIENATVDARDKEAADERSLTRYIQAKQEELSKLVEEFESEGGRIVKTKAGDWQTQGANFVAKVKKTLSMPGDDVNLTSEAKSALPDDVQFFMDLKETQHGGFYLSLCKVLYPNTVKKVKVAKKAGEKRTHAEAEGVGNDEDFIDDEDADVVEKSPAVRGRGGRRGGGGGK